MVQEERLQKFLASAGVASRRAGEKLIVAGKVKVNGKVVKELGTRIDPLKDNITVDGRTIKKSKSQYFILNKPKNVIVTMADPAGRKTLKEYIKGGEGLHPVGRLDRDTTGLLLITNDGDLTNKLIHPKYKISKKYFIMVEGDIDQGKLNILKNGVQLSDGITLPAEVELVSAEGEMFELFITIHEGRNRQIRRMLEATGCKVIKLRRVMFGPLNVKGLKPGEMRELTSFELKSLRKTIEGNKNDSRR